MTSMAMAQKLTQAKNAMEDKPYITMAILKDLIAELQADAAGKAAKSAGSGSQFKAVLQFAKDCAKDQTRPALAGAYMIDGLQMICDGFRALIIEKPFDALPRAQPINNLDVRKVFTGTADYMVTLPTLAALKAEKARQKAVFTPECRNDKFHFTVELSAEGLPIMVNGDYLINMIECIGDGCTAYTAKRIGPNGWSLAAIEFTGNGIKGVLLPINAKKKAAPSSQGTAIAQK